MAKRNGKRVRARTFIVAGVAVMFWRDGDDESIIWSETLLQSFEPAPGLSFALGSVGLTGSRSEVGRYAKEAKARGWHWRCRVSEGSEVGQWWAAKGWLPPKQETLFKVAK